MQRSPRVYVILALGWLAVACCSLLVGTTGVAIGDYWHRASETERPMIELCNQLSALPVPRLALGTLAGASLAVAGVMFQSLFRNPLASPYTLGVSSGAALGAALAITLLSGGLWYGISVVSGAAFLGAVVCVSVVYMIAHLARGQATVTLLLAGLTLAFISSALIVLVMFLAEVRDSDQILRWMMGSLEIVGMAPVYEALALAALAGGLAVYLQRDLDLLMMGEVVAASRGVSVVKSRRLVYVGASLLTAGVVAHCGPIGFVGLLVPHICRALAGPTHRHLLPAAALAGALFLPLCDLIARNAMWWLQGESRQIPVGVLTSLVGGGFFIYLLLTRRDRSMV